MQLNEVMIITDAMDENLYLSARNLPLVTSGRSGSCRSGQPHALCQRSGHAGCVGKNGGDVRMSAQTFSQEHLMQVILAPQVSEKATYIAEKHNHIIFRVAAGCD